MKRVNFIDNPNKQMLGWWEGNADGIFADHYIYVIRKSLVSRYTCDGYECIVVDKKTMKARTTNYPELMLFHGGTTKCDQAPVFGDRVTIYMGNKTSRFDPTRERLSEYPHTRERLVFDEGRGQLKLYQTAWTPA